MKLNFFKLIIILKLVYQGFLVHAFISIFDLVIDFNEYELPIDGFPVHFECRFTFDNQSFNVLFKRNSIRYNDLIEAYEELAKINYQYKQDSYSPNFRGFYTYDAVNLKLSNEEKSLKEGNSILLFSKNTTSKYHIIFTLLDSQSTKYEVFPVSIDNYELIVTKENKRLKRASKNEHSKNDFHINTLIHVEYSVIERIKHDFNRNDDEFARVYLTIYLTQVFQGSRDTIRRLSNDLFTINLHLININFDIKENILMDKSYGRRYAKMKYAGEYIEKYYNGTEDGYACHIWFITNYSLEDNDQKTQGQAPISGICNKGLRTSLNRFQTNMASFQITLAHELGHNFGLEHDNSIRNVMYSYQCTSYVFNFTEKSINAAYQHFKEKRYHLFSAYRPLKRDLKETIFPGEIYSLAKQCERLFPDKTSYKIEQKENCSIIICSSKSTISWNYIPLLDGTPCDTDKICYQGNCIPSSHINPRALEPGRKSRDYRKLMQNLCPYSSSSQNSLTNCKILNVTGYQAYGICQKDFYSTACCEECLLYKTLDCFYDYRGGKHVCKNKTCESVSNPCKNGGSCVDYNNSIKCLCKHGYSGPLCLKYNPCDTKPCGLKKCYQIGDLGYFHCSNETVSWETPHLSLFKSSSLNVKKSLSIKYLVAILLFLFYLNKT